MIRPTVAASIDSRAGDAAGRSGGRRGAPAWLLLLGAVAAGGYLATEIALLGGRLGLPLDDGWIHFQFARNLAAGLGLCYNPGEPVTGSTAPLWTALLALLFLLPGSVLLWAKLAGVALYLAGADAAHRLARELGLGPGLAALAAGATLGTYWLVWSALSGMEVPLFVALSLWGMVLQARERRDPGRLPLALPVLGLAALARPEGLLLVALAVVDRLLAPPAAERGPGGRRRGLAAVGRGLAVAALVLLPTLAVYAAIGGSPLPTTFGAKAGGLRGWVPSLRYLYDVVGILFQPLPVLTLLAGAGALRLVERLRSPRDAGLLPALWLVALPLAYSLLSPQGRHLLLGNFGRYFFPLFPVVAVLGCLALEGVAARLWGVERAGVRSMARGVLVALLLLPTVATLVGKALFFARNVANVEDSDVRMAAWLAPRLPPAALLAVQDIGALKFFLPNRVLDVSGIASPAVQAYVRQAVSAADPFGEAGMLRFLDAHRPDYLVAYPAWYPALTASPRFRAVFRLGIPDNITMAGDELVLFATPWTRYPLREPRGARADSRGAAP